MDTGQPCHTGISVLTFQDIFCAKFKHLLRSPTIVLRRDNLVLCSQCSEYQLYDTVACDFMSFGRRTSRFQWNILSPSSGQKSIPNGQRQQRREVSQQANCRQWARLRSFVSDRVTENIGGEKRSEGSYVSHWPTHHLTAWHPFRASQLLSPAHLTFVLWTHVQQVVPRLDTYQRSYLVPHPTEP